MDHKFYDVKKKEAVTTAITECKVYGEGTRVRYAVCGKTAGNVKSAKKRRLSHD